MDNKTKVKVAVVIGIIVLAVIFMFMIIFVKGNRPSVNKNIPKKTRNEILNEISNDDEDKDIDSSNNDNLRGLDNIISIGIKDSTLVAIDSALENQKIIDIDDNYTEFCYENNKIYIVYTCKENYSKVYEIDLNKTEYSEKLVLDAEKYGIISNIACYNEKLFFVSDDNKLVEYSISEEKDDYIQKKCEVSSFVIDKEKNKIYISCKCDNGESGIYLLDFTSNDFNKIITLNEMAGKMFLKGDSLLIDVKEYKKLYVYNSKQNTIVEIGDDNKLSDVNNQISIYETLWLYTDATKIDIKDEFGNSYQDGWYSLEENKIAGITMLGDNKLQVAKVNEDGSVKDSVVIDLKEGNINDMLDTVYYDVIVIK